MHYRISNPRSLNGIPVDVDHMYDNKNVMGTASDFDEVSILLVYNTYMYSIRSLFCSMYSNHRWPR